MTLCQGISEDAVQFGHLCHFSPEKHPGGLLSPLAIWGGQILNSKSYVEKAQPTCAADERRRADRVLLSVSLQPRRRS
jgi:hypothetical protein